MSRFVFAAVAGPQIGTGHVRRMITLAEALLSAAAEDVSFLTNEFGAAMLARSALATLGVEVRVAGETPEAQVEALCAAPLRPADAIVLDNYHWEARHEARLRPATRRIVVFDDLADRPHDADLLIDQNAHRDAGAYRGLAPAGCRVLAGPDFVLLPKAFRDMRARGEIWRPAPDRPVFLSLGGGDPGGDLPAIAETLLARTGLRFAIATGSHIEGRAALVELARATPDRLTVAFDSDRVAADLAACRFAVTAGGTMTWERAVLGTPSLSLVVADNQTEAARHLSERGVIASFDLRGRWSREGLADAVLAFAADETALARMSRRSLALVSGGGVALVAAELLRGDPDGIRSCAMGGR